MAEARSKSSKAAPSAPQQKKDLLNRLARVEGQLRGIQKLVALADAPSDCDAVAQQMAAARKALDRSFVQLLTAASSPTPAMRPISTEARDQRGASGGAARQVCVTCHESRLTSVLVDFRRRDPRQPCSHAMIQQQRRADVEHEEQHEDSASAAAPAAARSTRQHQQQPLAFSAASSWGSAPSTPSACRPPPSAASPGRPAAWSATGSGQATTTAATQAAPAVIGMPTK